MIGRKRERRERKIVLIGQSGVGKTTFVDTFLGKKREITPTIGVEVSVIEVKSLYTYSVSIWDCGVGQREKYWENADGAIVMFSLGDLESYEVAKELKTLLKCPSVLCGNKCDLDRKVFSTFSDPECYDISASRNYNLQSPILGILSKIENLAIQKRKKR